MEKNNKGYMAMASLAVIVSLVALVWKSQSSKMETLERVTNQRLAIIEQHTNKNDHPIWQTEAIKSIKEDVLHNDHRSKERRQEMLEALQNHEEINGHPFVVTKFTSLEEKLIEVETQFRHLDRFIQLLWQRTYNEPLPNPPSKD